MSRPQNGWGEPSYSQDIADNYYKTHHEDEDNEGSFIANDEDYLNGLYDDDFIDSNNFSYADTDDFRDRFDFNDGVVDNLDDDDYDDSMW